MHYPQPELQTVVYWDQRQESTVGNYVDVLAPMVSMSLKKKELQTNCYGHTHNLETGGNFMTC